jgi:hypothetical protein
LKQLHLEILRQLNPLREGKIREKFLPGSEGFKNLTVDNQKNVLEYGVVDVGELYEARMTVTRLDGVDLTEEELGELKWNGGNFLVKELAVYEMGENGTCVKLI